MAAIEYTRVPMAIASAESVAQGSGETTRWIVQASPAAITLVAMTNGMRDTTCEPPIGT